jgi:hypothetical protein
VTWAQFERAAKFLGGMTWATWELMIREEPNFARLTFIASVLGVSEVVRAVVAASGKVEKE